MKTIKNLILALTITLITACDIDSGIENRNEAKAEVETILKELKIEHDEVICTNGISDNNFWYCSINKKESPIFEKLYIIGTATCAPFQCLISLR